MKAEEITLKNARENKLFYFVANVVIFRRSDKRCLVLKRDEREIVHPGKYAVPGGKLEWQDLDIEHPTRMNGDVIDFEDKVEDLLAREVKEEAGIEIYPELHYINNVAFVRPDGVPVVLVKFAAEYKSGEVIVEAGAFSGFRWVNSDEVNDLDCIQGVPEEIEKTIMIFSQKKIS